MGAQSLCRNSIYAPFIFLDTILEKQSDNSNDIAKYDERLIESLDEISQTVKRNKLMLDKQTFDKMLNQSKNYSLGKCQYLWDC